MRKLVLYALLLSVFPLVSLGAVEGQWTYIIENGGATITASTARGAVTIPSQLGGYPVLKVGNSYPPVFGSDNTSVTSVVIPSSVTTIGGRAFDTCYGLTTLTIGSGVTSIGFGAFWLCYGLTTLTIPNSVTSIGDMAFQSCNGLTTLTIGSGVTSIGNQAFQGCSRLTTLTIPNSVTSIGGNAFSGVVWLNKGVILPKRFEATTTYSEFGLTASQVSFYDTTSPSYLMGQQSVINNPSAHNLYTATQYSANFTAGKNSILNSPNSNGLYTTSQIQNMAVGDLVLTRQVSGGFVLNYDIEQSTDLQTWTTYQALSLPLTGLPTDKAFVRIKAKQ